MNRRYFGTDGVRGAFGGPLINEVFAEKLAVAAGRFASRGSVGGPLRAFVGRDTRASGQPLVLAVASGLSAMGLECRLLGVVPTPAVAAAVARETGALGVVVTASHNPAGDNGIKFFGPGGVKLTDAEELQIESLIPDELPTVISRSAQWGEGLNAYLDCVERMLPRGGLEGWKIVLDTANGATCVSSPEVLRRLGAQVNTLGSSPDGTNINAGVGSEHPERMADLVKAHGACVGIAHDGDGDRCVLCDERGEVLDGDEILTLLALDRLRQGTLPNGLLVVTVQSNLGVDAAVKAAGGRVVRTAVGDRYVIERMRAEGAQLGGESSGHIILSNVSPTGDGLVAALAVLEVMRRTGQPLSVLRRGLRKFPQGTLSLKVREKRELAQLPHLPFAIQAVERELAGEGRVLVRYSGTEPKLRLLVEGPTEATVADLLARLEKIVRADLEVL